MTGLGSKGANITVYCANRPTLPQYQELNGYRPIEAGEISSIAEQTGNHWRKVFNVYARLPSWLS